MAITDAMLDDRLAIVGTAYLSKLRTNGLIDEDRSRVRLISELCNA